MKDEPLLVSGCPLCDIYLKKEIITKMYWPLKVDDIPKSEFIIIECKSCKIPMVIYKDHTTSINREAWGRILYRCKTIFGNDITLRNKPRRIFDHFHAHIENMRKY